jgi:hypothetical protein
MPAIAGTKFIEYPIQVFKTESDSRYGIKSIDGTLTSFENDAFGLVLQNRKDSTDRLQITTVTSSLTVDPSSNRDILIVIFLKRIIYLLIFFICIFQLEKLFLAFKKNQPFDLKNVKRINIIAYMIISISPVTFLFNEISIRLFNDYIISANNTINSHNLNVQYIFLGLLVLIIALAFKTGSQLQKESELTI